MWEAVPGEEHYNPIGTVHAGFATTLLDSAMGTAFVSVADAGTRWTTLELKANFTRPITAETGPVRCVGTVMHRGRTVVTTEARLEDARTGSSPTAEHDPRPRCREPLRTLPRLMDSLYDPSAVERRWQETWEADGPTPPARGAAATSRS